MKAESLWGMTLAHVLFTGSILITGAVPPAPSAYPIGAEFSLMSPGAPELSSSSTQSMIDSYGFCIEQVFGTRAVQSNAPPDSRIPILVREPQGVVGLSLAVSGPYTSEIETYVDTDSTGFGQSPPIYGRGEKQGAAPLEFCNPWACGIPYEIAVVTPTSVTFSPLGDNTLDDNPNSGRGKRIFPEKRTKTDDTVANKRDRVQVVTQVTPPRPGVPVFFRSFDVDDPSSNTAPLDSNGSDGGDNRGSPRCGMLSSGLALDAQESLEDSDCNSSPTTVRVLTDSSGIARAELTVSRQPGDNFRVAAACREPEVTGIRVQEMDLVDSKGEPLPTPRTGQTTMLTVWRKLHIETDTMQNVRDNFVKGTVDAISPGNGENETRIFLDTEQGLDFPSFAPGTLKIEGFPSYPVSEAIGGRRGEVIVGGAGKDIGDAKGKPFVLVDDDDFNRDDGFEGDGDEGEALPAPDTSRMQTSSDPSKNVFAPAYVLPYYDIGGGRDVPFQLNLELFLPKDRDRVFEFFDNKLTATDSEFWTVYLLSAYQGSKDADGDGAPLVDGEPEPVWFGEVDKDGGFGAAVYYEAHKETSYEFSHPASTAAHEIGHLLMCKHQGTGLMAEPKDQKSNVFDDVSLDFIRRYDPPFAMLKSQTP